MGASRRCGRKLGWHIRASITGTRHLGRTSPATKILIYRAAKQRNPFCKIGRRGLRAKNGSHFREKMKMARTKTELQSLAAQHGWTRRALTAAELAQMSADEYAYHTAFNRLHLQAALTPASRVAPPSASLPVDAQRNLAAQVLNRYPAYVWSDANAKVINGYLAALHNPRMDASDVIK